MFKTLLLNMELGLASKMNEAGGAWIREYSGSLPL